MQTQPIYHDTTAMPNTPDLDVICPRKHSTPISARYHLDVANAERRRYYPELPPLEPICFLTKFAPKVPYATH
jgi:hypothetical protein